MIKWTLPLLLVFCALHAKAGASDSIVVVDKKGVLRWQKSNEELFGFGVNYTAPFAYGYRAAKQAGIDLKKAIDDDVYHFARLGFDAFRVHVWDTEISDTAGNLLDNEHLELFDYLLFKMKQRQMRFLITPIAYWGNGWPEPDTKTPGFSYKYGKDKCLTDTNAIKAQERYLFQFLHHINRYTGLAYKDDPSIVAFEISNEPHHHEAPAQVTAFIKRMMIAMQNTGCKKPVFYNISHSIHLEQAYFDAGINGGTFQWYPTGLGFKQELQGNMLPNVDDYAIPFANDERFKKIAKVVYEFDAADVGRSYIYPAMARSFRKAGIQWATHFAYDPGYTASANTEYDTHFMNLVFAPQKALSLMIAGEVFHKMPLYKDYGRYPADTVFDDFMVSYASDLAVYNGGEKFIYTNHTDATPVSLNKLKLVAGFGNSKLVKYNGTGAYFIDKLSDGVWRLEVMPDAIWVDDPFGKNSPNKTNVVIKWQKHSMQLLLPALEKNFQVNALNAGNMYSTSASGNSFDILPGTYLVTAKNISADTLQLQRIGLREFAAPATTVNKTYVLHQPVAAINEQDSLPLQVTIISNEELLQATAFINVGWQQTKLPMHTEDGIHYSCILPASRLQKGFVKYQFAVTTAKGTVTYPSGIQGSPIDWDFYGKEFYNTTVVAPSAPIYIFNAHEDANSVNRNWVRNAALVPGNAPATASLNVFIDKLVQPDSENPQAEPVADYSMRFYFGKKIRGRSIEVLNKRQLIIKCNGSGAEKTPLQIALVNDNGRAMGALIHMDSATNEYRMLLSDLKEVQTVLLPRPYPSFLPYYFKHEKMNTEPFVPTVLQISLGPGLDKQRLQSGNGFSIESVRLE